MSDDDLLPLRESHEWQDRAECRKHPQAVFFPERGEDCEQAKAICRRCPVIGECLAYVKSLPLTTPGVWAGTSWLDRRQTGWKR